MITLEDLAAMNGDGVLYHASAKDSKGLPLKARLNGKLQAHKKYPERFRQPMKHGLYAYFYITQINLKEWNVNETVKG